MSLSPSKSPTMTMTDEELDREWKPNGRRPQSTIARSFSQELVDIFRIDESVADLDQKVDRRKHTISLRTSELQSLEARLREMEDRLKNAESKSGGSSPPRKPAVDGAFDEAPAPLAKDQSKRAPPSDLYSDQARPGSHPVGGDMPPTPGASEGITATMRGHGTQDHLPPAQNPASHYPRSTNPRPSSQEDGRQHHQTPHIDRTDQEDLADFVLISKDDGDR